MLPEKQQRLEALALRVREHIVRLSTDGGCFTGASLSCADLLVYLYADCLNVRPDNLQDPTRDYLFLSKGHDVPALYGTFVELGFIDKARLDQHLSTDDHIYWHPNRNVPGVESATVATRVPSPRKTPEPPVVKAAEKTTTPPSSIAAT